MVLMDIVGIQPSKFIISKQKLQGKNKRPTVLKKLIFFWGGGTDTGETREDGAGKETQVKHMRAG